MSDTPRPGEIDLEADPPAATTPPAESATTETPEAPAQEAATEQPADPSAEPHTETPAAEKKRGMLQELIEERKARQELERRLSAVSPVLQRLTPEIQQAVMEGRLVIQPPQASAEAEKARLEAVAKDLQLYRQENGQYVLDLDAAKRVDTYVRGTVQQAVEPVRHMTLHEKAQAHLNHARAFAAQHKLDVETVDEVFGEVLAQPNGAELLANPNVAARVWETAVGRMHGKGKLTAPAPAQPAKQPPPAAIITEAGGRRGPATSAIQLSPGLAAVYRDHGVDPNKAYSTQLPANVNLAGIELE